MAKSIRRPNPTEHSFHLQNRRTKRKKRKQRFKKKKKKLKAERIAMKVITEKETFLMKLVLLFPDDCEL